MFGGILPYWSTNCRKNPRILGVGNAFAGGVFIAIAFVHILPEQAELY
jgi:zinc transporter ZupT